MLMDDNLACLMLSLSSYVVDVKVLLWLLIAIVYNFVFSFALFVFVTLRYINIFRGDKRGRFW